MALLRLRTASQDQASILPFINRQQQNIELTTNRYKIRLAQSNKEIDNAFRLRFAIFNIELGEGLATSFTTGQDRDAFDDNCEQVLMIDQSLGEMVGTCRLRSYEQAGSHFGFYASTRFNLSNLPSEVLENGIEFGRVCLSVSHRNKNSFSLLCRFLREYAQYHNKRYLFGCCSLNSQDPLAGGQLYEWLNQAGHIHSELYVAPRPGSKCIFYKTVQPPSYRSLPSPFQTYLKRGAKICGMPAIDREFRTIDFFTLFDLEEESFAYHL
jgi:putative hemolysin